MRKFILLLFVTAFMVSCGGSKKVTSSRTIKPRPKRAIITSTERSVKKIVVPDNTIKKIEKEPLPVLSYNDKVQQYIYEFSEIAKSEMETYGIPASITLAQGILESGAGYGELTQKAKNHFGIKCHEWQGDRVYHDDDRSQECFRKYDEASESFRDHSLFLRDRKRYSRLFTFNKKDYKSWARGLREAGYATDKKYPQKLISIIERYQLDKYDDEVLGTRVPKTEEVDVDRDTNVDKVIAVITTIPNNNEHTVQKGDTLYSISRKYKISVQELKTYNKLVDNHIRIGQVLKVTAADQEEDFN